VCRIRKVDEKLRKGFWINFFQREISYCLLPCVNTHLNSDQFIRGKRSASVNEAYSKRAETTKKKQLEVYTRLKFELQRPPKMKEWEQVCKNEGIAFRLKTKHGFESFEALTMDAELFNHRVVSVEFDGYENVYNGTVDQHHNFFAGGWASKTRDGKEKFVYLNQRNCGEIPLCANDSCRLLAINLFSFVDKPFTPEAKFNIELFTKYTRIAQRLMDDIIDLELEKIEAILAKIHRDPESEDLKRTEQNLWLKIREKCQQGRRTGIGITGEGDMLAALGMRYGSPESLDAGSQAALGVFQCPVDQAGITGCSLKGRAGPEIGIAVSSQFLLENSPVELNPCIPRSRSNQLGQLFAGSLQVTVTPCVQGRSQRPCSRRAGCGGSRSSCPWACRPPRGCPEARCRPARRRRTSGQWSRRRCRRQ